MWSCFEHFGDLCPLWKTVCEPALRIWGWFGVRVKGAERNFTSSGNPRPITVLHVLPQDLNRGAQVYAGKLRDALVDDPEQDHAVVTLFAGAPGGARPNVELGVSPGRGRKLLDLRAVWLLRRLIIRRDADVVVAHGGEALKYVVVAAGKRPTVYYKVGLSTAEVQRTLHKQLYRFLSRRASCVVGNSTTILEQATRLFAVSPARQALIPNARDPQTYRPLSKDEEPADPPRILFVGQLESGKRPGLFLEAMRILSAGGQRFDPMIVGDGSLRSSLERQAASTGVQLLGTRADVPELMRGAAAVVMTSAEDTEGMPGVLIEAGLCGVPVVATPAAGVRDIVEHGVTGFLVEAKPSAVAHAVSQLLRRPSLRAALGARARQRCLHHFSISGTADLWRNLIDGLAGRRAGASRQTGGS